MAVKVNFDRGQQIIAAARKGLADGVLAGGLIIEADAKTRAPVKTGTLRRSINTQSQIEGDRAKAIIGPNTDYAAYVEFGTRRMAARPYMRPALDNKRGEARAAIIRGVQNAMGVVAK